MPLTNDERQQFLAEPHVGALAVSAGTDRGPLVVPIWYGYTPGGELWVITSEGSRKAVLIAAAERFTLLAERVHPSVRYVSVEGPVTSTRAATEQEHEQMARRYLGEGASAYLEAAKAFGPQIRIAMRPQRWTSADLGPT